MDKRARTKFRKVLEEMRRAILDQGSADIEPNRQDAAGRTDEDVQALNEMNQAIASRHNRMRVGSLKQIDEALARLRHEPEDFGLCTECEEEIQPRRLELMPYTGYCVDCQRKHDDHRGGARRKLTDYVG